METSESVNITHIHYSNEPLNNSCFTLTMNLQVLFGAVALTVSENYEKYVNFTYPISVQSYGMLIPRPKELSRLYLFIAPFTVDVRYVNSEFDTKLIENMSFFSFFIDMALFSMYHCADWATSLRYQLLKSVS